MLEELGSGSLSTVYKALDPRLGRAVALKVLRATIGTTSPFASQLEREAKVLAGLCHPNIGLLLAFVKTEARMALVLEYVDGFSLSTLLRKKPAVPPDPFSQCASDASCESSCFSQAFCISPS